jgi:hypothetical protein
MSATGQAESGKSDIIKAISIKGFSSSDGEGYGYRLQYHVPVPIETFWQFKTDFDNDFLLTNDLIVGHRLVKKLENSVVTESRYATAPGKKFLWRTKVLEDEHRLEFELINAEECRQDFHHGVIQLSPHGNYTLVTQTAYFDFTGASLWIKYPWYGGMKSTLKKIAKWEQRIAPRFTRSYSVAANIE